MEIFHWKEYWSSLKISLQRAYPYLSNNELSYVEGHEEELMHTLQHRLCVSKRELNELLFLHLITTGTQPRPAEKKTEAAGSPETN